MSARRLSNHVCRVIRLSDAHLHWIMYYTWTLGFLIRVSEALVVTLGGKMCH